MSADGNHISSVRPMANHGNGPVTLPLSSSSTVPNSTSPENDEWQDVTELFSNARKEMQIGELIHLKSFSLQSAMSAIELMDPKMDIGFGEARSVSDVVLPQTLSDGQVINVMDQLLLCFMSWLDAHTLPQTVFSCVYAQLLAQIPRVELLSFLRVMLATMESIINLVHGEKVADDEDFMTSTYGFDLHPLYSDPPEVDVLILKRLVRELNNRPIGDSETEKAYAKAISLRVKFQVDFYRMLQCLVGYSYEHSLRDAPRLVQRLQNMADEWIACPFRTQVDKELIQRVFDASINRHLMTSSPPRTAPLFDSEAAFAYLKRILKEIDMLLEHQRHTLPCDSKGSSKHLKGERHSLHVAMHSIAAYSAKMNPTVLTRSVMSRLMIPAYSSELFGRESADFRRLVGTDMGLTDEMLVPETLQALGGTRNGVVSIFKCLCRNRSRQRRQLLRVIRWWDHFAFATRTGNSAGDDNVEPIEKDDVVSDRGTSVNSNANAGKSYTQKRSSSSENSVDSLFADKTPLQVVAYEISAWLMTQHWLLGFECDLYQEYEYGAVYFHVGYVLTTMLKATVSLARKGQDGARLHPLRFAQYTMDEARLWMCRALYSALEGLSQGIIWNYTCGRAMSRSDGTEKGMFGSEALWYEQRFGVAMGMVNGPLYADYNSFLSFKEAQRESLLSSGEEADIPFLLLQDAANGFLTARRILEAAKTTANAFVPNDVADEILQIARASVENSIALSQMIRISEKARADQMNQEMYNVIFKFGTHRHFPVIEVTPI